jgi:uncharacterized membrane protein
MTTLEHSVFIEGTSDDIDAIALDPWRLPEWYAGITEVEPDDTYPEPGGSVKMVYKAAGATLHITMTVLELERGDHLLYQLEGMLTGTTLWTHTPESEGTWLTARFEYELPGGGLGKAIDKLVVERMNEQNLVHSLENLKALTEQTSAVSHSY